MVFIRNGLKFDVDRSIMLCQMKIFEEDTGCDNHKYVLYKTKMTGTLFLLEYTEDEDLENSVFCTSDKSIIQEVIETYMEYEQNLVKLSIVSEIYYSLFGFPKEI